MKSSDAELVHGKEAVGEGSQRVSSGSCIPGSLLWLLLALQTTPVLFLLWSLPPSGHPHTSIPSLLSEQTFVPNRAEVGG